MKERADIGFVGCGSIEGEHLAALGGVEGLAFRSRPMAPWHMDRCWAQRSYVAAPRFTVCS
jgi:hypothetical protein